VYHTKNKKAPLTENPREGRYEQKLWPAIVQTVIYFSVRNVAKGFSLLFFTFSGVSSMKRFLNFGTAYKAVMVGVLVGGMATACQNGNSPVVGFLESADTKTVADTKTTGAVAQNDEERKAEQNRKIAEFLAKPEVKEMSSGLEEIAQAVAVAVEDKALRERIYEKSMEKFDGVTNVLWMQLEGDSKLKLNGGWNKRINDALGKGNKRTIQNVDAAIKKFEKVVNAPLHLYWMNAEAWDKKTTPLVAFVPFDVNPKTRTSIPAFDAKGNRFELGKDGALAKQRPVIVVNVNERTDVKGNVKKNIVTQNSTSSIESKGSAQVQSAYVSIQLTSCTIPSVWAFDELPWDGPSEFIIFLQTALGGAGSAYLGNVPTGSTQSVSASLGYSLGFGQGNTSYVLWYEDDFDPFDDYMYGWSDPITVNNFGTFFFNFGYATYTVRAS
jgi:hypothetical protein